MLFATPCFGAEVISEFSAETLPTLNDELRDITRRLRDEETAVQSIALGGTGQITAQTAIDALTDASSGGADEVWTTDGTNGSWQVTSNQFPYIDGTVLEGTIAATERSTSSAVYVKLKEIALMRRAGDITVSFELQSNSAHPIYAAKGKVYIDGVAAGSEKTSVTTNTYAVVTETGLTVAVGEVVQVYVKIATGIHATAKIKNMKILCANPTVPGEVTGY